MEKVLKRWRKKASDFEKEAHSIFLPYGTKRSRVLTTKNVLDTLTGLSITQEELFKESLRCIENFCYKSAHVMAWAAFFDFLCGLLGPGQMVAIRNRYPNWRCNSVEELKEYHAEYAIIEGMKEIGLFGKTFMRTSHGLLAIRNECAHPSGYEPGFDEALGFISSLLTRLKSVQKRYPVIPPP